MLKKNTRPIITIDGPASSGKGTISKALAKEFNLFCLETGVFYRILGREFLANKKEKNIKLFLDKLNIGIFNEDSMYKKNIYNERVAEQASKLAKLDEVRAFVLKSQLKVLETYSNRFNGIILEGRDCGTVIAPKASLKFFLNAKLEVRARRRYEQLKSNKSEIKYEEILNDLIIRDKNDTQRKISPLIKAYDAYEIDCSFKTIEETIMIVKKIILSKLPNFN